jgi:DME family drug/metabolite transporter
MHRAHHQLHASLRIGAAAALFASAAIAVDLAPAVPPAAWAETRAAIGGIALAIFAGPRRVAATLRSMPPGLIAAAGASMAFFQALFFYGVQRSGPIAAAWMAGASAPLAAAAWDLAVARARPRPAFVLAAGLFVAALAVERVDPVGMLCCLAAGCAYCAYTVSARASHSLASTCVALLGAAIALAPLALAGGVLASMASAAAMAIGAYLAIACTALAYVLFVDGLRWATPALALAILLLQPMITMILGLALPDGRIDVPQLVAALLFLAASLFAALSSHSKGDFA